MTNTRTANSFVMDEALNRLEMRAPTYAPITAPVPHQRNSCQSIVPAPTAEAAPTNE
ncbi:hypothetical protein JCM19037_2411 [Geomicrobium sp. JCM 19037]|nr:hypothetical protein [Geomicrobium sp. JCM 19037]GAK04040.1 hypothetical protein JCM19037_2411 [Geomicrobium sp. JCM 19037]